MKKIDRKTEIIRIRVSENEKKRLKKTAKEKGYKNLTEYILNSVKNYEKKTIQAPTHQNETIYHLSRIGNNLNQISYKLNKLYKSKKIDNEILKEISEELMFMNLQIAELL